MVSEVARKNCDVAAEADCSFVEKFDSESCCSEMSLYFDSAAIDRSWSVDCTETEKYSCTDRDR